MNGVRVHVPASSANLGPGFDVLAVALNLYNTYDVWLDDGKVDVQVEGEGAGKLPSDGSNLFVRAAGEVFKGASGDLPGLRVRELNRIPLSRGLGSSAATIVGGLLAARELSGGRLSDDQVLTMAADLEGHPDNVAAALKGGLRLILQNPDRVRSSALPWPDRLGCALFIPDIKVSTKSAREALPEAYPRADVVHNLARVALFASALMDARIEDLRTATEDRLHQPYRAQFVPGLDRIIKAALDNGAGGAFLSGAGPTVLAIYDKEGQVPGEQIAAAMAKAGAASGLEGRPLALDVTQQGARVEALT